MLVFDLRNATAYAKLTEKDWLMTFRIIKTDMIQIIHK